MDNPESGGSGGGDGAGPLRDAWGDRLEYRDDVVAKPRTQPCDIRVGGVDAPSPIARGAESFGVNAANLEHGTDEQDVGREAATGGDTPKAARTGAAEESHQQRFELILRVVASGDETTPVLACELGEGPIALPTSGGLNVPAAADAHVAPHEWNADRITKALARDAIGLGLHGTSHVMDDMGGDNGTRLARKSED